MDWRFGTIGFSYNDWENVFYPREIPASDRLRFYSHQFNAVEIDSTFHAMPDPARVAKWSQTVDPDFRFALKAPKAISHELPIRAQLDPLLRFVDVARNLGPNLGPLLVQYPPNLWIDLKSLEAILKYLPADVDFTFEFRHDSWFTESTYALLREMHICLAGANYLTEPRAIVPTTNWLFIRLIGEHGRFEIHNREQTDVTERLAWWQAQIESHAANMQKVWVVVGDDFSGYAVPPARRLAKMLGAPLRDRPLPNITPSLFE